MATSMRDLDSYLFPEMAARAAVIAMQEGLEAIGYSLWERKPGRSFKILSPSGDVGYIVMDWVEGSCGLEKAGPLCHEEIHAAVPSE